MPAMIRMPLKNGKGPVNLLEQNHARQFVRQGHLTE